MPTVVKNSMLFYMLMIVNFFLNLLIHLLEISRVTLIVFMGWSMQFNITKCKILHLGKANPHASYMDSMSDIKDLGILADHSLKFHLQTSLVILAKQIEYYQS